VREGEYCDCPSKMYDDVSAKQCKDCKYECAECVNGYECTDCIDSRDPEDIPTCGCVDGKYLSEQDCFDCEWPCLHCTSNALDCSKCVGDENEKWSRVLGSCYCPAEYYDDGESDNCQPCAYRCITCINTASECETCAESRTPKPECDCVDGYYDDGVNAVCPPCGYKCDTCEDSAFHCNICKSNRITEPDCDCDPLGFYEQDENAEC